MTTSRSYPLLTLLQLRERTEQEKKQELALALASETDARELLSRAKLKVSGLRADLELYQESSQDRRAQGFTIAERRSDAEDEYALTVVLRDAELAEESYLSTLVTAQNKVAKSREALRTASTELRVVQEHHKMWKDKLKLAAIEAEQEEQETFYQHRLTSNT